MASRSEVTAWVHTAAWDDQEAADAVVDAILASGTDDEATWVAIAGGGPDDVAAAWDRSDRG